MIKKVLAEYYVRPDEAEKVKSTIRERGALKIIDKVTVGFDEKRDDYEALMGLRPRAVVSAAAGPGGRTDWRGAIREAPLVAFEYGCVPSHGDAANKT